MVLAVVKHHSDGAAEKVNRQEVKMFFKVGVLEREANDDAEQRQEIEHSPCPEG